MKKYDIMIVGASVLGAAIALKYSQKETIVIEQGCIPASEFSAAFKSDGLENTYTDDFAEKCREVGIITANGAWVPAISPLIAQKYIESGAHFRFSTIITNIENYDDCYSVELTSFGATEKIIVNHIIDTTTEFITGPYWGIESLEYKNIMLNYITEDKSIHHFAVSDTDISSARLALINEIRKSENNQKIVAIASELDYCTDLCGQNLPDGCNWIPSAQYGNFLSAFNAGEKIDIATTNAKLNKPEINDDGDYDIIVVGLGTAGSICALAAAKKGLRVLGIENQNMIGGSGTAGSVQGYYYGYKGGLYRNIDELSTEFDDIFVPHSYPSIIQKAIELDKLFIEKKISYRLKASLNSVEKNGNKIKGISYIQNGKTYYAKCKYVIDCSADSVACIAAGCTLVGGRESDGRFQLFSSCFTEYTDNFYKGGYMDNGAVDQYDPDSYGNAVIKAATSYIHLRKDYSERSYLGIVPLLGLREGKRILGCEEVRFSDLYHGKFTDKPIYYGFSNLDNHGKDSALEDSEYQDWITICGLWGYSITIPVPLGALISKEISGLLVAGRNICCDHTISTGLRMKDDVQKSGECAAIIAYLAIKNNCPANEIDYNELQKLLLETGCLNKIDGIEVSKQLDPEKFRENPLNCDTDTIIKGLTGDKSGYYMWLSMVNSDKVHDELIKMLSDTDRKTRENSALALSLANDNSGSEILLEMIQDKKVCIDNNSWMFNAPRAVSAICAVGKLKIKEAVPILIKILNNLDINKMEFEKSQFICDENDLFFQYSTTIITALCKIAKDDSQLAKSVYNELSEYIKSKKFEVTMMCRKEIKLDCTQTVKSMVQALCK